MSNWVCKGSISGNSGATTTDTGFSFLAPPGGSLGDILVVWLITSFTGTLDTNGSAGTMGPIGPTTPQYTGWKALYSDLIPSTSLTGDYFGVGGPHLQAILAAKLFYPDADNPGGSPKAYHVAFPYGTGAWGWITELWTGSAQLNRFPPATMDVQGPGKVVEGQGPFMPTWTSRGGEESANGGNEGPMVKVRLTYNEYNTDPSGNPVTDWNLSHPKVGDYVVGAFAVRGVRTVTAPTGWTEINRIECEDTLPMTLFVYGKFFEEADKAQIANPNAFGTGAGYKCAATEFVLDAAERWWSYWFAWPGVDPTTPVATSSVFGTTVDTDTGAIPAITTTRDNSVVVVIAGNRGLYDYFASVPTNLTSGVTGPHDLVQGGSIPGPVLGMDSWLMAVAGDTGITTINWARVFGGSAVNTWGACQLALNKAVPSDVISFKGVNDSTATPPETDGLTLLAVGVGNGAQISSAPSGYVEKVRVNGAHVGLSLSQLLMTTDASPDGTITLDSNTDSVAWIVVARMLRSFEYNNDTATAGAPVLTGAPTATNTIDLSWTAATAAFGVITEYDILRDDGAGGALVALATVLGTMMTYHDRTAAFGKDYTYQVFGRASGIAGALSNTVTVATPSSAPINLPSIPTGLRYTLNNGTEVDLIWNPSIPGSSAITGYTIYQDGVPMGTATHPSYHDTSVQPATVYSYTVDCYDANGAQSGQSLPLSITTPNVGPDVTAPSVPTALVATPISGTEIDLTWTASTDSDSPALGYTVYRDTNPVGAVSGTSFADHGLTPVTLYTYNVDAYDPAGNHSAQSPNATATTLADSAPAAPAGLGGFVNGPYGACLAWTAAVAGSHAVAGYTILRDAIVIGTTTAIKFTDVTCDPARTYVYTVQAFDTIGLASVVSATLSLTTQSTLWTLPKTWELSDPATSIELNTYGRDNLLHLKGTGWTSFTYLNGFSGYHGDAQYGRKGPWIYLQGMVTGPADNLICTRLPPSFCPLRETITMVWGRIGVSNVGLIRVSILPTGDVLIGGGSGLAGVVTYCSLNQICFSQDGR
jgi:chitodextrinase